MGYTIREGNFLLDFGGYTSESTHDSNGLRITRPRDQSNAELPEIWLFGCSFTYGWSVDDNHTWAWKLQEKILDFNVVNLAVGGYGTVHSIIQLEEALTKRAAPVLVVLTYAHFHDERNTFSRSRRKHLAPLGYHGITHSAFAQIGQGGTRLEITLRENLYSEFPFMRSFAVVHLGELAYNRLDFNYSDSRSVTERLVQDFIGLTRASGAIPIFAPISAHPRSKEMMSFANELNVAVVDLSLDLTREGFTNTPFDNHPSKTAHKHFAKKFTQFIHERSNLSEPQRSKPRFSPDFPNS